MSKIVDEIMEQAIRSVARAIEAEVRKQMTAEAVHMEMAASAEANRVDELTELRKQDEALIQQLVEHLENHCDEGPPGGGWQSSELKATLAAGHARLEDKL